LHSAKRVTGTGDSSMNTDAGGGTDVPVPQTTYRTTKVVTKETISNGTKISVSYFAAHASRGC
jgi:hypothetical protein